MSRSLSGVFRISNLWPNPRGRPTNKSKVIHPVYTQQRQKSLEEEATDMASRNKSRKAKRQQSKAKNKSKVNGTSFLKTPSPNRTNPFRSETNRNESTNSSVIHKPNLTNPFSKYGWRHKHGSISAQMFHTHRSIIQIFNVAEIFATNEVIPDNVVHLTPPEPSDPLSPRKEDSHLNITGDIPFTVKQEMIDDFYKSTDFDQFDSVSLDSSWSTHTGVLSKHEVFEIYVLPYLNSVNV